jgi:hypothetical protein
MPDPQSRLKSLILAIAKVVSISSALLFSVLITIYFSGKTIPELKPPIALEDAGWLADGGTMWLMLKDADGKQFLLGVNGSMDRDRSEFPVVVQRWYPWVPLAVTLPMRGYDERDLLNALDRWMAGGDPASMVTQSLGQVRGVLAQRHP